MLPFLIPKYNGGPVLSERSCFLESPEERDS